MKTGFVKTEKFPPVGRGAEAGGTPRCAPKPGLVLVKRPYGIGKSRADGALGHRQRPDLRPRQGGVDERAMLESWPA
ncbi:hypothetical protein GO496_04115 [Acidovorax citrulli]|nr:hypothetical protein [Paracidovorax citrulli]